jgi:hypothetical protein
VQIHNFSAIDQVKVISLSCAKNTSASFSAVAKKVHDFFYLCKKCGKILPVSKSDVRPSQCVYCSRHDPVLTLFHLNWFYTAKHHAKLKVIRIR